MLLFVSLLCCGKLDAADNFYKFIRHLPNGQQVAESVRSLLPIDLPKGLADALKEFELGVRIDESILTAFDAYEAIKPKFS